MRKLFKNIFTPHNVLITTLYFATLAVLILNIEMVADGTVLAGKSMFITGAIISCITLVLIVYKDINRNKE
jgi:hypothetical protein